MNCNNSKMDREYFVRLFYVAFPLLFCTVCCTMSSQVGALGNQQRPTAVSNNNVTSAHFSEWYETEIDYSVMKVFKYQYEFKLNETKAIRVVANTSLSKDSDDPVLFVVRQLKGVMSWQLPMRTDNNAYYEVGRNVCPLNNYVGVDSKSQGMQNIYVDITSDVKTSVKVWLKAEFLDQYLLSINTPVVFTTSPAEPKYFEFNFPTHLDMVFIEMNSPDDLCMTFSIQEPHCPIYDLNVNVKYSGYFQTVSRKSGMTVKKSSFPKGFVIVVIVKDSDSDCVSGNTNNLDNKNTKRSISTGTTSNRIKTVSLTIKERITRHEYQEATFGALGVFLVFYVFSLVVSTLYAIREWKNPSERSLMEPREESSLNSPVHSAFDNHYGSIAEMQTLKESETKPLLSIGSGTGPNSRSSPINIASPDSVASSSISTDTDQSFVEPDVDMLDDVESEKDIFRTKTFLFVADLARKDPKRLRKKSRMYHWNLLTIAVFYALPVVQLVFTYQKVSTATGNEDLCYYNFLCAYPQSSLTDFNHVYSNIGYILLGFLFLGLVWRRDLMYRKAVAMNERLEKYYGIPAHFGLFYSMGIALMMEGVLSGCYHVCPNYSNFQFDTTFMYLIAWLCMLKIYQTRHPDINPNAHAAYVAFACVIIICVMGVLFGTLLFWIFYAIIHVMSCLMVSAQIYYMGRWKMNLGIFKRLYLTLRNDLHSHFTQPMYMDRLILLAVGNVINWSFMIYGLVKQPKDVGSFLVSIFIINLLLYTSFYVVMKIRHKEKILPLPFIYIMLSGVTWVAAIYFFLKNDTSWKLSPAESRNLNQPCFILHFYDDHDVWHFLSSSALFFSFMILLTLDDDLIYTPRDKIPVF